MVSFRLLVLALFCYSFCSVPTSAETSLHFLEEDLEMEKLIELHGLPLTNILEDFGRPIEEELFLMEDGITEFRVELLNIYPPENPDNNNVEIKELSWNQGEFIITLWFHKKNHDWVVVDSRKWYEDVDF